MLKSVDIQLQAIMRDSNRPVVAVSVVIPTYNGSRHLAATLESVFAQSVAPAEIIVVDDGSRDDSAAIAEAMGATVLRQENRGICGARNRGIAAATQPWVALLDHDDRWLPDKLEVQWAALQRAPDAAIIATDCVKMTDTGEVIDESFALRPLVRFAQLEGSALGEECIRFDDAAAQLAKTGWFLMPSASLVRREVLLATGGFDERTPRCEDVCCFLRVLMHGPLVFIARPLTQWVIHETNTHLDDLAMMRGYQALDALMHAEPAHFPDAFRARMRRQRGVVAESIARLEIDAGETRAAWRSLGIALRYGVIRRSMLLSLLLLTPPFARARLLQAGRILRRSFGHVPGDPLSP